LKWCGKEGKRKENKANFFKVLNDSEWKIWTDEKRRYEVKRKKKLISVVKEHQLK
jgi:hypothetical protein